MERSRDRRGRAVAVALLAVLAACASTTQTPPYAAPTGGETARLVMRGSVPVGHGYGMYHYANAEQCGDRRLLGFGNATRNPATTSVAVGRTQTVEFLTVNPAKQFCFVRLSFDAKPGKSYLLTGGAVTTGAGGCYARVMDMSNPDDIKPEPSVRRRNTAGNACVPLAAARPANAASDASGSDAVLVPGAGNDDLRGLITP